MFATKEESSFGVPTLFLSNQLHHPRSGGLCLKFHRWQSQRSQDKIGIHSKGQSARLTCWALPFCYCTSCRLYNVNTWRIEDPYSGATGKSMWGWPRGNIITINGWLTIYVFQITLDAEPRSDRVLPLWSFLLWCHNDQQLYESIVA